MPQFVVTAQSAVFNVDRVDGSLAAAASLALSDSKLYLYFSTEANTLKIEALAYDGSTYADVEDIAGTALSGNSATFPTLASVLGGDNVRIRNTSAGSLDYWAQYVELS